MVMISPSIHIGRVAAAMGGGLAYWQKILNTQPTNLIGLWRLNEGPTSQNYLTFNGTSTQINCGSGASLDDIPSGAVMYIEMWVNPDAVTSSGKFIMKALDSGAAGWSVSWEATNNRIQMLIDCATTDADSRFAFAPDGSWHHIAILYDDTGDRKAYGAVDGVWAASYTAQIAGVGAYQTDAANNLKIGVRQSATQFFDGKMGWIRISNTARETAGVDFTPPSRTTIPTVDANTISLWPMNEGYGSVAGDIGANNNDGTITNGDWAAYPTAVDSSPQGNDGAYTGVALGNAAGPDGVLVPLLDGVNDYCNFLSAGFIADFNGAEITVAGWAKKHASMNWADGNRRQLLRILLLNNYIYVRKSLFADTLEVQRNGGGAGVQTIQKTSFSPTDWFHWAATASESEDKFRLFIDGAQVGADVTGLGAWSGNPTIATIGSADLVPTEVWYGYLGLVAVWKAALSPAEILALATV